MVTSSSPSMLVNGRTPHEVIVRKRHIRRVKITSMPARQPFHNIEVARVNKRHRASPRANPSTKPQAMSTKRSPATPSASASISTPCRRFVRVKLIKDRSPLSQNESLQITSTRPYRIRIE
jgi:hypothetical protein